jgi:threonylcarbamoyladenosine tRNA methylthiotransferase MtaB
MKRISFVTLGCKTNQFESAAMAEAVSKEGYQVVPSGSEADICVINTCTVTGRTDAESRRLIRRALRSNPAARIVVTGCYAQIAAEEVSRMPGVSLILGNNDKRQLLELLRRPVEQQVIQVSDVFQETTAEPLALETFAEHTRAFLQVQNGCDARCSYCIVPFVRGHSRSVSLTDAVAGIRTFADKGFQEVVLTGIHLGAFGLDLTPPSSLLELVTLAEQQRLVSRLRLGSIEPTEIPDLLIDVLATAQTICPHLHIPLQSGDDGVLAAMNRPYSSTFFQTLLAKLTTALPEICIGSDLVVGFPGETDESFQRGYEFIQAQPLAYLHVFPFSPRAGTPAATMPNRVPPAVIKARAELLRNLSLTKKRHYFEGFIGKEVAVLVQEQKKGGELQGLARNYVPVLINNGNVPVNREVLVRITTVEQERVRGELV